MSSYLKVWALESLPSFDRADDHATVDPAGQKEYAKIRGPVATIAADEEKGFAG
jgi:hypothetical protein